MRQKRCHVWKMLVHDMTCEVTLLRKPKDRLETNTVATL